ncbi:MAG: TIGR03960 family B12-binding radical SAM protein [bacterium]
MSTIALRDRFERGVLPYVRKPHRYIGSELHRIVKPHAKLRWAFAFPDLYEIGMSSLGLQILYHRINTSHPEIAAERVFLPEEDAAQRLRSEGIPLLTLETGTPVHECDLLGISLSYEMVLPGMLELLDLSGVPIHASERGEAHPIVIAGGPLVFNPEPFADFIDLAVLGDGEEVVVEISKLMLRAVKEKWPRAKRLDRLEEMEGVYRPASHVVEETTAGRLIVPVDSNKPLVTGCTVEKLQREYYPERPMVPMTETVFDRLTIEVMRGCTRGCRFCQAGNLYRPVRERDPEEVVAQAVEYVASTGYEEISLASLSTSDYSGLPRLIEGLRSELSGRGVSLSFPSLRPDSFTLDMARALPDSRKGSLTFAPEAGTQRLRDLINKNTCEDDLIRAATLGFAEGYTGIKLYFMIGLPGETHEDLDGIVDLALKVAAVRVKSGQRVTVSINPFAPKAHTPFQRFSQNTASEYREKLAFLKQKFRRTQVKYTGNDPESAILESAIARGDRRLGRVIERVWRKGAMLEAWGDRFDPERWHASFAEEHLDLRQFVEGFAGGERLPWAHLTKGITESFFAREMERAERYETAPDCREGKCDSCGLMKYIPKSGKVCNVYPVVAPPSPSTEEPRKLPVKVVHTVRIRYRRGESLKWTGHLDMVRVWDRLLRRAGVPVAYSQGYHPHPRIRYSPPLPVGLISDDEYVDLDLAEALTAEEVLQKLCAQVPEGLVPVVVLAVGERPDPLSAQVEHIDYGFRPEEPKAFARRLDAFLRTDRYEIQRRKGSTARVVDLRSYVDSVSRQRDGVWMLRLNVRDGATARLDELAQAWGLGNSLGPDAIRLGLYVRYDGRITRPLDAVRSVLSRAGEAL